MKKKFLIVICLFSFVIFCSDVNDQKLIEFSEKGDLEEVQKLVEKYGADLEAYDTDYRTPLMRAAKAGKLPVVRYLVGRGAKPNTTYTVAEKSSHTALIGAMCKNTPDNTETALFLLDHNADPLQRNWGNGTALMSATYNGNELLLDRLLKYEGQEIYLPDVNHSSALTFAIRKKDPQVRQRIRKKLLEYDIQNNRAKYTDLTYAIVTSDDVKIQELLEQCNPNEKDQNGNYPLYLAVITENVSAVRNLLEEGADPNVQNSLYNAIKLNCLEIAELLLKNGANLNEYSIGGFTPLTLAITDDNLAAIELLLRYGADVNLRKVNSNYPPLLLAVKRDLLDAAKVILKYKPNVEYALESGYTPLLLAIYKNNLLLAQILLEEYGANIDCRLRDGYTPLHLAIYKNNKELVELILKNGGYNELFATEEKKEYTPMQLAEYYKYSEIVELLEQYKNQKAATSSDS